MTQTKLQYERINIIERATREFLQSSGAHDEDIAELKQALRYLKNAMLVILAKDIYIDTFYKK